MLSCSFCLKFPVKVKVQAINNVLLSPDMNCDSLVISICNKTECYVILYADRLAKILLQMALIRGNGGLSIRFYIRDSEKHILNCSKPRVLRNNPS